MIHDLKTQKSSNIDSTNAREIFFIFLCVCMCKKPTHMLSIHTIHLKMSILPCKKNSSPFFSFFPLFDPHHQKSPAVGKEKYFTVIVVDVVVRVCNIVHINGVSLESAAAMAKKEEEGSEGSRVEWQKSPFFARG